MEFTRNEKKAIIQFISAGVGAGANKKAIDTSFIERMRKDLNIASSSERQELREMRDFNEDELFSIMIFS